MLAFLGLRDLSCHTRDEALRRSSKETMSSLYAGASAKRENEGGTLAVY